MRTLIFSIKKGVIWIRTLKSAKMITKVPRLRKVQPRLFIFFVPREPLPQ